MESSFSFKALTAGVLAAFVGFAGSFAIVVQGLNGVGASTDEAALITFLVTASGVTFFGIGGAIWGLVAGGAIYLWDHRQRNDS